ncbi:hypothetical protein ACQPT2_20820 [Erwinia amylovora]
MAIIFIPSLAGLLLNAEQRKGSLLTQQEVEAIRDSATCISVPDGIARNLDPSWGYTDSDPQRCWEEWCLSRTAGLAQSA